MHVQESFFALLSLNRNIFYFDSLFDDVLGPRYVLVGNVVLLLKILQIVVRSDLAELAVFFEKLGDLIFVGGLVDFVGAVELFNEVHQPQDAVDLFLVLQPRPLLARQVDSILHQTN